MDTNTSPTAWVGIDVAKNTFEACLLRPNGKQLGKAFANDAAGFAKMQRWIASLDSQTVCHYCMEATGAYHSALALFLAQADERVSVINPYVAHHAAVAYGQGNKTDKADARTLAAFCRKETPALWRAAAPEVRTLVALLRRLESVQTQRQAEANRLGEPGLIAAVQTSLEVSLAFLDTQMAHLREQIEDHIQTHPGLKADRELLESIPGVGQTTAHWLLAELPDVTQFSCAQDAAAYAGLNPQEYTSGTSVSRRTRLSKRGNVYLRKALFLPALTALRFNPCVAALCQRLRARGKTGKAVVCAAMRKLLMQAFGVLKNRQKFDPQWQKKAKATA